MPKVEVKICQDCRWWGILEEDPEVGDHGACHHPVGEAQCIAYTGETAPNGLNMEGARRACPLYESKGDKDHE